MSLSAMQTEAMKFQRSCAILEVFDGPEFEDMEVVKEARAHFEKTQREL